MGVVTCLCWVLVVHRGLVRHFAVSRLSARITLTTMSSLVSTIWDILRLPGCDPGFDYVRDWMPAQILELFVRWDPLTNWFPHDFRSAEYLCEIYLYEHNKKLAAIIKTTGYIKGFSTWSTILPWPLTRPLSFPQSVDPARKHLETQAGTPPGGKRVLSIGHEGWRIDCISSFRSGGTR